jgi:hypothetical protein
MIKHENLLTLLGLLLVAAVYAIVFCLGCGGTP